MPLLGGLKEKLAKGVRVGKMRYTCAKCGSKQVEWRATFGTWWCLRCGDGTHLKGELVSE